MSKKLSVLLLIIASALVCLTSCGEDDEYDAKVIGQVPPGFTHMEKGGESWENGLRYVFWEGVISFLDADGITIYQTLLTNSDFIVKNKDEYYINEEKFLELTDIAAISCETRRRVYHFEDAVEIRGAGDTIYTVKIVALETGATRPTYQHGLTTYEIEYTASCNNPENVDWIIRGAVETNTETRYSDFAFLDTAKETLAVQVEIRGNETIEAIVLKSPDYPGLSYRITVDG